MDRKILYKLGAIALLTLLLMVPLALIEGQIKGRSARQAEVLNNIAQTAAGPQTLIAPLVAIQYKEWVEAEPAREGAAGREAPGRRQVERVLWLPAEDLKIGGQASVETRSRGIYQGRLYHLDLAVSGRVVIPAHLGLGDPGHLIDPRATLVMGLSDLRGVENDPEITINGSRQRFATPNPASRQTALGKEMPGAQLQVDLGPVNPERASQFDFSFPLKLTGTERLAIAPTAEANHVSLKSDWRHPSFQGRFLPRTREVGQAGFSADWEISYLARNLGQTLQASAISGPGFNPSAPREALEISFMEPVTVYLQAERAVKYGSLFIVLTFAAFFLGEVLRRRAMHPVQYLLVGLALAIFFLLLIALSEHLPFVVAYLISATGCIGLIAFYLAGALGGIRQSLAFGAGLTGLYGVLYGLLLSEDNALLMGSVLLFVALGAIMLATRRVNWYRLGLADDSAA